MLCHSTLTSVRECRSFILHGSSTASVPVRTHTSKRRNCVSANNSCDYSSNIIQNIQYRTRGNAQKIVYMKRILNYPRANIYWLICRICEHLDAFGRIWTHLHCDYCCCFHVVMPHSQQTQMCSSFVIFARICCNCVGIFFQEIISWNLQIKISKLAPRSSSLNWRFIGSEMRI